MKVKICKKKLYILTLFGVLFGMAAGIVFNPRLSIMCFILFALIILDYLSQKSGFNMDALCIFLSIALHPYNRIGLAINYSGSELVRYVTDYCDFNVLDIIIFLLFLRLLHTNTKYERYDFNFKLQIIFLALNILSLFQSVNLPATFWTCVRCLKMMAVFEYFKYNYDLEKHGKFLFYGGFIAIVPQTLICLVQYIKRDVIGLSFLGEVETLALREVDGSSSFRPSGTFEHPANMAFFAMFILIICLYQEKNNKITRIVTIVCSFVLILASGSRTIMVLTALAIAIWVKTNGLKTKKGIAILMCGFAGIFGVVFFTSLLENIMEVFVNSDWAKQVINRTTHWSLLMFYIIKKPILGYGANVYTDITESLANAMFSVDMKFYLSNPCHNIYLQYWFDLGIGGMVVYALILLSGIKKFFKLHKKKMEVVRPILISCFAFICTLAIYNFTGWAGLKNQTNFLLFMTLGILYSVKIPKGIKSQS